MDSSIDGDRNPADTRIEWLTVAGDVEGWRSLGLTVVETGDGSWVVPLIGTALRIVAPNGTGTDGSATGIVGWAVSGIEGIAVGSRFDVDGLATEIVEPAAEPTFAVHDVGAQALDHVVVLTDDLARTSGAIADATGCELKRIREVGPMRQGFHRIGRGGLIVELVERPEVEAGTTAFWGVVLIVDDLDRACAVIGEDRIGAPKDAVQPGRRIATVRAEAGLGLPVALMTN